MKYNELVKFVFSIIICEMAGAIGSAFTFSAIDGWYKTLEKSPLNPPNWIFGPVWTILYILMGISLYIVWSANWKIRNEIFKSKIKPWNRFSEKFVSGSWQKLNLILIFAFQLVLNSFWSIAFFGLKSPGLAFFVLLMLWFAILYTIINFYRVSKISAYLLIPYILWVSFAGYLNYSVWILN